MFNTLRLRQNDRLLPDDIFKCIFFNENVWISIKISLKFVPKGLINNIPGPGRLKIFFGFSANVEAKNGLHHIISNSQHFYAISKFLSNF